MTDPVQLAFATDAGFFEPTIIAMTSALGHCPKGTVVFFLGTELSAEQTKKLRNVVAQFDQTTLHFHPLSDDDFDGAIPADPEITLTALARLFLPKIASGRVLYLDGDTLVCDALAPLYFIDMEGFPIAAVRDQHVLNQVRKSKSDLSYFQHIMAPHSATAYFNSGILLLDLDAINNEPDLVNRMQEFHRLKGYRYLDQDHLNHLFGGRVCYLPHRWNSVWGRSRRQNALWRALGLPASEIGAAAPSIIHFTGPKKPWKKLRLSTLTQSLPVILKYRRFSRRWRHVLDR